jgi:light-regulated signal transduction histidine kinase (bacteriophytochrome)
MVVQPAYLTVMGNDVRTRILGTILDVSAYGLRIAADSIPPGPAVKLQWNDQTLFGQIRYRLAAGRRCVAGIRLDAPAGGFARQVLANCGAELKRVNEDLLALAQVTCHDLQLPLSILRLYLDLLARTNRPAWDEESEHLFEHAWLAAERIHALTREILAYSRTAADSTPPERVDLNTLLREVREELGVDHGGAAVTFDQLPKIASSRVQLRALFKNLIANGIRFNRQARPEVHIGVERRQEGWLFSVCDNGIAVPPEQREEVFRVCSHLNGNEESPGRGTGLAICRRIVERMGGEIRVESPGAEGATFFFTIPFSAEPSSADDADDAAGSPGL